MAPTKKRSRRFSTETNEKKDSISSSKKTKQHEDCEEHIRANSLPRVKEISIQKKSPGTLVIGVDEAGRGPIAGPVVAAAVNIPTDIKGVTDSKKITSEDKRNILYEAILSTPGLRYAIAVIDNKRIDKINILEATLEGMRKAVNAVIKPPWNEPNRVLEASAKQSGSYVLFGVNDEHGKPLDTYQSTSSLYYTLIDGNKIPSNMPCPSQFIIKGDSKEFCIAAASILAKVTRDRIMNQYHEIYPDYNLIQHKGYPTAAHMKISKKIGPCPIHRRSFAPFKEKVTPKKNRITTHFTPKKKTK